MNIVQTYEQKIRAKKIQVRLVHMLLQLNLLRDYRDQGVIDIEDYYARHHNVSGEFIQYVKNINTIKIRWRDMLLPLLSAKFICTWTDLPE